MTIDDVLRMRLTASGLLKPGFASPSDLVGWLTAVQAQDYAGAKWAVGQRLKRATNSLVDDAFQSGRVLRTHVLRPTWHFVLPEDLRWLLRLTAPRLIATSQAYYRQTELDEKLFTKSRKVFEKSLCGNNYLTRDELAQELSRAKIQASGIRLALLVMRAELDAVIVSGPRRGKQFTYALVDERAPQSRDLERDEALAELARRYFASHGPALPQDFAWWSGLNAADARRAIELAAPALEHFSVANKTYWFVEPSKRVRAPSPHVLLLPNYDEYVVAYKDRSPILGASSPQAFVLGHALANHVIVKDGVVIGAFRRALSQTTLELEATLLEKLDSATNDALHAAAQRYANFLELKLTLRTKLVRRTARRA